MASTQRPCDLFTLATHENAVEPPEHSMTRAPEI